MGTPRTKEDRADQAHEQEQVKSGDGAQQMPFSVT